MQVTFAENQALIADLSMEPSVVFHCGQNFRFYPFQNGYRGVALGRELFIEKRGTDLALYPVTPEEFHALWRHYFDLDLDYAALEAAFLKDPVLAKALPSCRGMRLFNQDPFETIISFIISANNNEKRIRGIVDRICTLAGHPIKSVFGDTLYAFPTPEALASLGEARLRELGAGYRAAYIANAAKKIADGFDLAAVAQLKDTEARKRLMELDGVGPKVADCILLFAYNRKAAFPKDVWIRRVLAELYGLEAKTDAVLEAFVQKQFGAYGGIAQQYLFHYARQSKLADGRM